MNENSYTFESFECTIYAFAFKYYQCGVKLRGTK